MIRPEPLGGSVSRRTRKNGAGTGVNPGRVAGTKSGSKPADRIIRNRRRNVGRLECPADDVGTSSRQKSRKRANQVRGLFCHRSKQGFSQEQTLCKKDDESGQQELINNPFPYPPSALRIAANMFFPDSAVTGCFAFSSACSTSSGGSSFRNGDGWHGRTWPYFFRPPQ